MAGERVRVAGIHPALQDPVNAPLEAGSVRQFLEDGYISIDSLIDGATVAELRGLYDAFLSDRLAAGDDRMLGGLTRQVMHPSSWHPRFRDNPAIHAAAEVTRQLLGAVEPRVVFDMLLWKQPGNHNTTPWHQDYAYAEMPFTPAGAPIPNATLNFWIPLDDVDVENGCMQFIPGLHLNPLLPHYVHSGDPADESRLLATDDYDESRAIACPLRAGGCTVHSVGALHFTGGNHSADRGRRAYIFTMS
ncbi:MAG: phytanoyl-CoA dioxygenase family protein [Candidatus Dormibacteria bacterium]